MLSVLISVYNWDVNSLVKELHRQLLLTSVPFEIILGDDASETSFYHQNKTLTGLSNVAYKRHSENIGRAAMRNRLADLARFPYLIFIDCDAGVVTSDFIQNYLRFIKNVDPYDDFVVLGGVAYRVELPEKDYRLRWYYGKRKEEVPAVIRTKNPYRSFTPFNFLITKSLFETIRFEEQLTSYGHEDTLFGCHLKEHQIKVYHIDNPLYHEGLDKNEEYLRKIESSIMNLVILKKNGLIRESFIEDSRLLFFYEKCKKYHVLFVVKWAYVKYYSFLRASILQKQNLFLLDFYKLGYLASLFS